MEQNTTTHTVKHWYSFKMKVVLEGILVGFFTGLVIVLYRLLLNYAGHHILNVYHLLKQHSFEYTIAWFVLLSIAAIMIGKVVKRIPMISGSGIPQIKGVLLRQLKMQWLVELITKFFGGVLTIGSGLSLGREGPSVQIGAQIGQGCASLLKRHPTEQKFLITSGASAGLSASFNAPLAGVIFALEELHKSFSPVLLACVMASSLTADFVSKSFFGMSPVFNFKNIVPLPLSSYYLLIFLGILCAVMGKLFNSTIFTSQVIYEKMSKFKAYRMMIPFLSAGILGFILPDMLGGGHELIEKISVSSYTLWLLLLFITIKLIFTAVCFGSGAPGGIFLPLLAIGALVGKAYGVILTNLFNINPHYETNFMILAMVALFTAIVRAPITGGILILEMTGSFHHLLSLITVAMVSYIFAEWMNFVPIYDGLLDRILKKQKQLDIVEEKGEKVLLEIPVSLGSQLEHQKIKDISWPDDCLIISIKRGEKEIIPSGDTELYSGDFLVVLTDQHLAKYKKLVLLQMGELVG